MANLTRINISAATAVATGSGHTRTSYSTFSSASSTSAAPTPSANPRNIAMRTPSANQRNTAATVDVLIREEYHHHYRGRDMEPFFLGLFLVGALFTLATLVLGHAGHTGHDMSGHAGHDLSVPHDGGILAHVAA